METRGLEDFVSLAETRSFSRAAQLRHITQPAFSRRIQALEAWAGVDLVDRSAYPTRLTPAGQTLYAQALDILQSLQAVRSMLRGQASGAHDVIEFAVPHTLAFAFFPQWLSAVREGYGSIKSRLHAMNVHDAVLRLVEGGCDVLMAYHHGTQPVQLDPERYDMVVLGQEWLAPYARADAQGAPLYRLPGSAGHPVPYLAYAPGAYLGQVTDRLLQQADPPARLDRIYETDMAEGLKAMALAGHGVAFLPHSAVQRELEAGRLASALPVLAERPAEKLAEKPAAGGPGAAAEAWQVPLEVRAYRARPGPRHPGKPAVEALWSFISSGTKLV
jgi:DNA-binding transcriptional LysR family regulator